MKKRLNFMVIAIFIALLTGCGKSHDDAHQIKWAQLDLGQVESLLSDIAKEQNPYPVEYNQDRESLQNNFFENKKHIKVLRRQARDKCDTLTSKQSDVSKEKAKISKINGGGRINISTINANPKKDSLSEKKYRQCVADIDNDQLISDLIAKSEVMQNTLNLQKRHDRRVASNAKDMAIKIVAEYSVDRFDVVLNSKYESAVFNKSGVVLDVTDAVLEYVKASSVVIKLDEKIN